MFCYRQEIRQGHVNYLIEGALNVVARVRCHILQSSTKSTQAIVWLVTRTVNQPSVSLLTNSQIKTG